MSSLYPRALSSNKSYIHNNNKFYSTSFQPISYYSSLNSKLSQENKMDLNFPYPGKTLYLNESKENYEENSDKVNYNKEIFRSGVKRTKHSPFYSNEKSLRLQDEIDWINKLIKNKSNLNISKLIRINPAYINNNIDLIFEKENEEREKEVSEHLINGMRLENLNKIIRINNRLKNRDVLLNKRGIDNYNYKNFMYQMNKFKYKGISKWKNDFYRKFSEY